MCTIWTWLSKPNEINKKAMADLDRILWTCMVSYDGNICRLASHATKQENWTDKISCLTWQKKMTHYSSRYLVAAVQTPTEKVAADWIWCPPRSIDGRWRKKSTSKMMDLRCSLTENHRSCGLKMMRLQRRLETWCWRINSGPEDDRAWWRADDNRIHDAQGDMKRRRAIGDSRNCGVEDGLLWMTWLPLVRKTRHNDQDSTTNASRDQSSPRGRATEKLGRQLELWYHVTE
jgi:hypothetical protein